MHTKILRYSNGGTIENPRVGIIRIADGKLQFDGEMFDSRRREFFEKEYNKFKTQFPNDPDRKFLENWVPMLYTRTTYVQSEFVPKG